MATTVSMTFVFDEDAYEAAQNLQRFGEFSIMTPDGEDGWKTFVINNVQVMEEGIFDNVQ